MKKRANTIINALASSVIMFVAMTAHGQNQPVEQAAPTKANNDLLLAYQKEYALLLKQKRNLEEATKKFENEAQLMLQKAQTELAKLQADQVALVRELEKSTEQVENLKKAESDKSNEKEAALASIQAAKIALRELGYCQNCQTDENSIDQMATVFGEVVASLGEMSLIRKTSANYFGADGQKIAGEVIKVGQIATYATHQGGAGVLAPAGGGNLKLYKGSDGKVVLPPKDIFKAASVPVFLYESTQTPVEELQVKNLVETINEGGRIGWVIVSLGILSLLAILYKVIVLTAAARGQSVVEQKVDEALSSQDLGSVEKFCKNAKIYSARLVGMILSQVDKGGEALENAFNQGFIEENRHIDRFTMFITVVAAVAPLFGLLGTVMGMIETFDVITKVGTGNPKVLSAGIAEALIATMLGLLVAIPSLLAGNLLNAWAAQIKTRLESVALKIASVCGEKPAAQI